MCIRDSLLTGDPTFHQLVQDDVHTIIELALAYADAGCWGEAEPVSYTHLRAHETVLDLVCRLLLETKKIRRACITSMGRRRCVTDVFKVGN